MEDKLVTLAILTYTKAQILKNVLENEGIETYIHNVNQIQPVVSSGVRLRIKESDLPRALKITESSTWLSESIVGEKEPKVKDKSNKILIPVRQFDHRNGYVHQPADDQSGRGWRAALKHLSIDHHRLRHLSAATLVRLTRHRTKALSFENGPQEYRPDRTLVLHSRRVVPGPGL